MQKIQKKIKKFCQKHKINSSIESRLLDTMSELGEVSKEVLKMTNYGKEKIKYKKRIEKEIGDLFFSLITVANFFDIDLEKVLEEVLEKYKERFRKSGSIGSKKE